MIVAFIYTNCKDECPLISAKFGRLRSSLTSGRFHLVEISLDPSRDTPSAIAKYARRFNADPKAWSILTGDSSALSRFWRAAGESVIAGAHGEIIHNDRTLIVGPDGEIRYIIEEASWTPDEVAAQAEHVAGESSNPFARMDLALGRAVAFVCGGFQSGHSGLADVLGTIVVLGGFGLILWLVGRKIFSLPS